MMLFLRRVLGAVILIGVFIFSAGMISSPLHPPPGWLERALLHSTIHLLLTAAAGWLMMRPGGGMFARRVRIAGMALIANFLGHGSFLSLAPASYGLFGSRMQQVLPESYMMFDMVLQPLAGLFLWLGGGLVDDDAARQWQGWRRLVRLAGIALVVGSAVTGDAVGEWVLCAWRESRWLWGPGWACWSREPLCYIRAGRRCPSRSWPRMSSASASWEASAPI